MNNIEFNNRVNYVESESDETVCIAIDVSVSDGYISWFDTVKERIFEIEEIIDRDTNHFVFRAIGTNWVYTLVPINMQLYEEKIKGKLINPGAYTSIDQIMESLLKTKDNAW